MNNNKKRIVPGSLLALGLATLLGGCGSLPDMEDAKSVDLRTHYRAPWAPEVDVDGDPELRAGAMAKTGLASSMEVCNVFFMFCALYTVPVYAVTGAAITAADTLPEEQAEMLNRLTEKAADKLHLPGTFNRAMVRSAVDQGLDLRAGGADIVVEVVATEIWWEVSIGNQVSLRLTVEVHAIHGSERGMRRLGYRSQPVPAKEMLAGGEQRIRDALQSFMPEASEAIWQRLLDRD